MYSVDLQGYIPRSKWKEFKQHMKHLASHQTDETIKISVLQNLVNEDLFEVKMDFNDKETMFLFLQSDQYASISGSFRALGMLIERNIMEFTLTKMKSY